MDNSPTTEQLRDYREVVRYGWSNGPSGVARDLREEIGADSHGLALDEIDANLLGDVVGCRPGDFQETLLIDNTHQPLDKWWWHLGQMREGRYPIATLPRHLRDAYAEAAADRAADESAA